jgi:hypothetical protein
MAKANADAHREKLNAVNQSSPQLDGAGLADALLKNLGFE